jgi:L-type amino acid transporter 9
MGSILISAGQPAERWVVRGIALSGKIRLPQSDNMIATLSIPVIFFVTGLHGLTPKLGILLMNVSLSTSRIEGDM